jgi:hypothetical protein
MIYGIYDRRPERLVTGFIQTADAYRPTGCNGGTEQQNSVLSLFIKIALYDQEGFLRLIRAVK